MPKVSDEYLRKKKEEIIDAAYRVCVNKPVTSVEMKDVIKETGFSHGAIYRYYSDLDEILHDLVIRINSESRFDDRLDEVFKDAGTKSWESVVHEVFGLLASHIRNLGPDILKLSIYSDVLAMSDPERAANIAGKLGSDEQSPMVYFISVLTGFLSGVVKKKKFKPVKTIDEIMQFIIVSYNGIQTGCVLSGCFDHEDLNGKYEPEKMFSCLADTVILMIGGKTDVL